MMNGLKCWRSLGVLLVVLAPLALSPAGAGAQEGFDAPPVVTNVTASPSSLPAEGGLVTIFADAGDENGGVTWVQAEITGPFGGPETVLMGFTGVGQTYSGSLTVSGNFTESPMSYSIVVQAIDLGGNSTWASGGGIVVDAAPPPFDERPVATDASVAPRELPSDGGASTIRVTATDDRSISEVSATITRPDGSTTKVPLEGVGSSQFEGVLATPANTRATAAQYAIEVTALDDSGQSASADAGLVTVAAEALPPNREPTDLGRSDGEDRGFVAPLPQTPLPNPPGPQPPAPSIPSGLPTLQAPVAIAKVTLTTRTLGFTASRGARATVTVERRRAGRCTLVYRKTVSALAGANRLTLPKAKLRKGTYRVTITPAGGKASRKTVVVS